MIIAINKPIGLTSYDVVKKIKKITNQKKVGHGGTLDPFADGVLIIGIGRESTKKLNTFLNSNKEYIATLLLGIETDTLDKDGKIIKMLDVPQFNKKDIKNIFVNFTGSIDQLTPLYSARKVSGMKLYEYARNNIQVERPINKINIYDLSLISIKNKLLRFKVSCSKGTYIRQLGYDISEKLGSTGHLVELTRTKVGNYSIENCITFLELKEKWIASTI